MMKTTLQTLRGHIGDLKRSRRTRDVVLGQIGGGLGAAAVSASRAGMAQFSRQHGRAAPGVSER